MWFIEENDRTGNGGQDKRGEGENLLYSGPAVGKRHFFIRIPASECNRDTVVLSLFWVDQFEFWKYICHNPLYAVKDFPVVTQRRVKEGIPKESALSTSVSCA